MFSKYECHRGFIAWIINSPNMKPCHGEITAYVSDYANMVDIVDHDTQINHSFPSSFMHIRISLEKKCLHDKRSKKVSKQMKKKTCVDKQNTRSMDINSIYH